MRKVNGRAENKSVRSLCLFYPIIYAVVLKHAAVGLGANPAPDAIRNGRRSDLQDFRFYAFFV